MTNINAIQQSNKKILPPFWISPWLEAILAKPSLLQSIVDAFSTSYYTYQNFIIRSWFLLQYFSMTFLFIFVVAAGGLSVAFFQYGNEIALHKLTRVSGTVEAYHYFKCISIS